MDIKIFTCYHKNFETPQSDIIFPIHVGKEKNNSDLGFQGDNTKDNISAKNPYYCELTATYWIWKNIKADIVGLFHYRRFLNLKTRDTKTNNIHQNFCNEYGLTSKNIQNLLNKYDILLPKPLPKITKNSLTVYENYKEKHIISDLDCVIDVISQKYPLMSNMVQKILKQEKQMYPTNILICKKELFDEYSEWLFSILFEVEKRIHSQVLTRNSYQQRVYGFLSERMMNIFISYKISTTNIKVGEFPTLYIETDEQNWKKYKIKRIKNKILSWLKL